MRDIPFEMKLIGAGSDPAAAPFASPFGERSPSEHEIAQAMRRARAERAEMLTSLFGRLFGRGEKTPRRLGSPSAA